MSEEEIREEEKRLERESDLAVIEYFTKLRERERLKVALRLVECDLDRLEDDFRNAKVAHLKAKHGITD